MSIVPATAASDILLALSLKFVEPMNSFIMDPKIFTKIDSLGYGKQNTLKCLTNLAVKLFLPPPGGAPAHTNVVSSTCFQNNFYLSKNPPLSIKSLNNSIQG